MGERIYEGLWEEIARRGSELAGHQVRLTVLDEPALAPAVEPLDRALAQLIEDAERLAETLGPLSAASITEDWGETAADKHRRHGFTIVP